MFYLIIIKGGLIDNFLPINKNLDDAIKDLFEEVCKLDSEDDDAALYHASGELIANAKMFEG